MKISLRSEQYSKIGEKWSWGVPACQQDHTGAAVEREPGVRALGVRERALPLRRARAVAEAPWSGAEWAVALRLDYLRATVVVLLLSDTPQRLLDFRSHKHLQKHSECTENLQKRQ